MSVGDIYHIDLSDRESLAGAKNFYESMQYFINLNNDRVERHFIVGDSCKCDENNPR
jgi:hypothetical protein